MGDKDKFNYYFFKKIMIFYYRFLQMWAIFDNIEKKIPFFP